MSKLILPRSIAQKQVDRQAESVARRMRSQPKKLVISKEQAELMQQINAQVARQRFLKGLK